MRQDEQYRDQQDAGFTLIEMVAVVVIIGILAAVAIPITLNAVNNSKYSAEEATLATMQTALEEYAQENNQYPAPDELQNALSAYAAGVSTSDVWGQPIQYNATGDGYILYAPGPSGGVEATSNSTPTRVANGP
ncbi:prepilin-type N-terminal cleavage/methylation domain-containing protein [Alicyclobacillus cycloheptanicus]|uniref:Type II secretion system protein G n=1 Tax=Alicyclobacillus cycloheptanicus TaxID=1457 RepID=A0ABT9XDD8_9BACL|nr:prepilin-type N-terminal cleavage/methylation domain-containing protein [Alicyclobacillus cycloheptanicus]MDQ0188307.1 type II secretion system protein G [Alicyclobacillus cycloheptanicus]WDM01021.1 prepilin-type N-terminal cleavage/methylation domain-containing protein [Alicyclobacillus cycloheptanicus]